MRMARGLAVFLGLALIASAVYLSSSSVNGLKLPVLFLFTLLGQPGPIYSALNFSIVDYLAIPLALATSTLPVNSYIPLTALALIGLGLGLLANYKDLGRFAGLGFGILIQFMFLLNHSPNSTPLFSINLYITTTLINNINNTLIFWEKWYNLSIYDVANLYALAGMLLFAFFQVLGIFINTSLFFLVQNYLATVPIIQCSPLDFIITIILPCATGFVGGLIAAKLNQKTSNILEKPTIALILVLNFVFLITIFYLSYEGDISTFIATAILSFYVIGGVYGLLLGLLCFVLCLCCCLCCLMSALSDAIP
ncbi:MAG: hypothetical protein QXV37_00820 [Candidatus Jordarchaeaceae archaeon]